MKPVNASNLTVTEASDCRRLQQRQEIEMNKKPDNSKKDVIVYPTNMESPTVTMLCDECGAIIVEGQRKCWYCGQPMAWEPKTKKARK